MAATVVACSLDEGGADRKRGGERSAVVDVRNAGLAGCLLGFPGQAHDAGQRLDGVVVAGTHRVRAGLAEARQRAADDAWVDRLERSVVEAELLHHTGAIVVEHDVGGANEVVEHAAGAWVRHP